MTPRRLGFHPEAAAEYRAAAAHYEDERVGLGAEFATEVEAAAARLIDAVAPVLHDKHAFGLRSAAS